MCLDYVNIGRVHACTSNDVAQTGMCLVKVRWKAGYTKHMDWALGVATINLPGK
jgi:hypothetical protein